MRMGRSSESDSDLEIPYGGGNIWTEEGIQKTNLRSLFLLQARLVALVDVEKLLSVVSVGLLSVVSVGLISQWLGGTRVAWPNMPPTRLCAGSGSLVTRRRR